MNGDRFCIEAYKQNPVSIRYVQKDLRGVFEGYIQKMIHYDPF